MMRFKKMIFFCLTLLSLTTVGQTNFGVKGGANLARLSGDGGEAIKLRTSFYLGALVEFELSESFSIQPEVLYSSQGGKQDFEAGSTEFTVTQKQDYLAIPILGKYYVSDGFFIEAGPQVAFLLDASGESSLDSASEEEDLKDFISSTDIAFNLGVGYQFSTNVFVNARFVAGLTNINDDDAQAEIVNNGGFETGDQKNQVFQIGLGYRF